MSNCVNCGLAIVPPGVAWAGMSCRCFTETGARLDAELDAIRSRLQALEQNTVPPAKQKPREWWLALDSEGIVLYTDDRPPRSQNAGTKCIHVREVLDD
jgi:hypothetical protein